MKDTFKSIIHLSLLGVFFFSLFLSYSNIPVKADKDQGIILAEPQLLHFEIDMSDNDDINIDKFYDDLYSIYGLRIYSAHTKIPLYFQSDYDHIPFSTGTIATSGCGISCLSMIVSYLQDEKITPDKMAYYDCGPNPAAAMESAIRSMKLNCEAYYGDAIHEYMWDAIEAGRPVIANMRQNSLFTDGGHFIVIAGMTEDGKYIVNDPSKKNYEKNFLKEGFQKGFTKEELSMGLVGVRIFDKKEKDIEKESLLSVYTDVMSIYLNR